MKLVVVVAVIAAVAVRGQSASAAAVVAPGNDDLAAGDGNATAVSWDEEFFFFGDEDNATMATEEDYGDDPGCLCPGADGVCHQPGETYAAPDGCNTCLCDGAAGATRCTKMLCGAGGAAATGVGSSVVPPPPKPSCPCPGADGVCHQPGETYAAPDGCNTCFCDGGGETPAASGEGGEKAYCTKMFCGTARPGIGVFEPGLGVDPGGIVTPPPLTPKTSKTKSTTTNLLPHEAPASGGIGVSLLLGSVAAVVAAAAAAN